ncbi:PIN domain-containing protein [Planctomycetota bacterium]
MYVFDTNSLSVILKHYYPERFPSLWIKLDEMLTSGDVVLVRESYNEIMKLNAKDRPAKWAQENRKLFSTPSLEELQFVNEIFAIAHFQQLIEKKKILSGRPVADPFVIAKAKIDHATVVTEEVYKENASKIPNVCEYFNIECINLEDFMQKENWQF